MTIDDTTKKTVLKLLAKGLITQSEAARLAGVSRQLMRHWAREIDVDAAREHFLTALWQKSLCR